MTTGLSIDTPQIAKESSAKNQGLSFGTSLNVASVEV